MPNKGQWDQKVQFRSELPGGYFYLEEKGFSYLRLDREKIAELHHRTRNHQGSPPSELGVDAHAVKVDLLGASKPRFKKKGRSSYYANFYKGEDRADWASKVHPYEQVTLQGIYSGVDMSIERKAQGIKYSFECDPHSDASRIRMKYKGHEELKVTEEGELLIRTSLGPIRERSPKAFQWVEGQKEEVPCRFKVEDNVVTFQFPEGYDKAHRLLIDPNVIFSTYTGSTSDNWGNTATYDKEGALYAGGTVFGSGYPTTTGAYQLSFAGGDGSLGCDVSITKFTPDGTGLVYSTYLGGSANELPHSLVVGPLNRLYVLGSTGSNDFPIDSSAAIPSFMGGSSGTAFGAIPFNSGTDAFISKLSGNGSILLGSTYMGGSSNDGLNEASDLNYNYGDILRGEVEVDGSGNAYIVSTTRSNDIPVTSGVVQDSLSGGQDAFIAKLKPDLSSILYCTYYGGSSHDAGYAIERNPGTGIYISGGTKSNDLLVPSGWQTSKTGGVDGYVTQLNSTLSGVINASYIGTSGYDQSYFVGRDSSDNILIYGQSDGTYPVVNASYSDPNSGQFIQMLPPDLSTSIFSTVFGTGSGNIDISPSAFMVSECNNIYLSGWGGNVNQGHGVGSSTTNGLTTTSGAYQKTTDGSDFYLMVLGDSASSLKYASFFGGGTSDEHVDGGTSRFDEQGIVYQAVCGGCGGNSDFPTTSGAYSSKNQSSNCNLAAFKFDLSQLSANIDIQSSPIACQPDTFDFEFSGTGGVYYEWDFGDGTKDSGASVSHYYSDTGTYKVSLVVHDTLTCRSTDTAYTTVQILDPTQPFIDSVSPICPGDSVQLNAGGGFSYQWSPPAQVNDPTKEDPLAWTDTTEEFQVVVDACASDSTVIKDTAWVTVPVHPITSYAYGDTSICPKDSVQLHGVGGSSYAWSPSGSLNDSSLEDPLASPSDTTVYTVSIVDSNGCENQDMVKIDLHPSPSINAQDATVCKYDSVRLTVSSDTGTYQWDPPSGLNDPTLKEPMAYGNDTSQYEVTLTDTNGCSASDSMTVAVLGPPPISTHPDTAICRGDSLKLSVNGGIEQTWSPAPSLSDTASPDPLVFPDSTHTYQVRITDSLGCHNYDSVTVGVLDLPKVSVTSDTFMCIGDTMQLMASGGVDYQWDPSSSLDDPSIPDPKAFPTGDTKYRVLVTNSNGCTDTGTVNLLVDTLQPQPQAGNDTLLCKWDSTRIWAKGGHRYEWDPPKGLSDPDSSAPLAEPLTSTTYIVDVINGCGVEKDSVSIKIQKTESEAGPDSTICPQDSLKLWVKGGETYEWYPPESLSSPDSSETYAYPSEPTEYRVIITDSSGCKDTSTAKVELHPIPDLWAGSDLKVEWGSLVNLSAEGDPGTYIWHPEKFFEDPYSQNVSLRAKDAGTFWVELIDTNECRVTDSLDLLVSGSLYAPNAFTPDGDGVNDIWRVKGENIGSFHLKIFNRWGELFFETRDMNEGWDGTVEGRPAKQDVYVYQITYTEAYKPGVKKEVVGHITLVR